MSQLGVDWVAIGHGVHMPDLGSPVLTWGRTDKQLRRDLRTIRQAGLRSFLLPRIESPAFFEPPYPFRADIDFKRASDWRRFHGDMERMLLHYAQLAQEEGVEIFGLGLELRESVLGHPEYWQQLIPKVRRVFHGKLTYSANWHDEWEHIEFWDQLDYIGVGAYFELGSFWRRAGSASSAELVGRWQASVETLSRASKRFGRPVLFTEAGYSGFVDCAERPWEWAGKWERGVPIDHGAQARALRAMFEVVRKNSFLHGVFLWSFHTDPGAVADWEYGVLARPAEDEVRRAYLGP